MSAMVLERRNDMRLREVARTIARAMPSLRHGPGDLLIQIDAPLPF
jgi:hypothetical protein